MSDPARLRWTMPFSIIVSSFGFIFVLAVSAYGTRVSEVPAWQEPAVGSIFAFVCVTGMFLAWSPRRCSETLGHMNLKEHPNSNRDENSVLRTAGHHYNCGRFLAHTVQVNGHVLCAACTGLFLGAIGAIFGTIPFFFVGPEAESLGFLVVVLGVTAMVFGFLQFNLGGFARLMLNVLFVLGAFLILVGVDGLMGSFMVDLFTILMIGFWIFTRTLLSQHDHWKICCRCPNSCENKQRKGD